MRISTELIIDNSYSQLKGLKTQELSELKKLLSYTKNPGAAFFAGGFIRKTYMIDKQGRFPTGLLHIVADWLRHTKIRYIYEDIRRIPKYNQNLFKLQPFTPYKWQSEASVKAYQKERGGIVAPTGTGKSATIAMIILEVQVPTLIIVPTIEIKKQLMADISRLLGNLNNIIIENIDSNALNNELNVDCLILDECHHAAAKTYQQLNKRYWNNIYYRFFLSATFFRNNYNEALPFEAICGREIYRLTHEKAVKEGYIVPIEAYYIDLPEIKTEAYTWQQVYKELITNNTSRNLIIFDIMKNLNVSNKSTLCLVKEIAHGKKLSGITGFPFVNSQDDDSRRYIEDFKTNKINILIGTEGILSEGVDTKPCEYVLICGLGKAKSRIMQSIGRCTRTYPGKISGKIILFRDRSHKFCLRHFKFQCKVLKDEYGAVPEKL